MATKMFYVTRDMKHPLYRGRMLKAGETLELDGPTARLYRQLNAITDEKSKDNKVVGDKVVYAGAEADKPRPKRSPRKRTAKRTAKKNA
jgi:hypothetical protein